MPPKKAETAGAPWFNILPVALTIVSLIATLWTRATVAELRAAILEQQQQRIEAATATLTPRREFDQLLDRVKRLEEGAPRR
jgi:hypothetical protein